ncbi:tRNA (adenosine(37)-N6)-dimethylallyltransferase MiaA [Sediminibacterium sp.]|uniref:tRNA (adenosine(37)-N6)-dimethylallyltransferase MiaA n=1 Tax=Sediminibacterium sp. TaxID=1917865 RepID=UPI002736FA14|nr:tRNA (adenosine(37)-N6)-dimethylallyltransferase MiaA [Sediminibacterium sp.]MDP3392789.1 tRNA (adenosine(37)-N6)-dimethylallyltransferase MiaA [Sediminibacterium sp.]MDP3565911.1 tRNA (adenosine(37)-N6)-dimethylallyltransferase MiaA [Sediminibacterium sp.]
MKINPTIYILAGPTAVGKTAVSIALAKALNTEIISADSRQCFTELSIGVARPSEAELAAVEHYFIADHSVETDINAGYFEKFALDKTEQVFTQKNQLVMVGGTGLYIRAFCDGIDPMPEIPAWIREFVVSNYQLKGLIWLQSELKHKDPAFWKIAEQSNPQRLMRALEVFYATRHSILHFRTAQKKQRPFSIIKIGLEMPMDQLTNRINLRVDQMIQDGLIEEVQSVLQYRNKPALQTVGYKEVFDYLDGNISKEQAILQIKHHTRQYAKRQMTWFKKDPEFKWINMAEHSIEEAIQKILG